MLDLLDAPPHRFSDYERDDHDSRPEIRILRQSTHTTQRPRKCICCGRVIRAGARYTRTVAVVDGCFEATAAHRWGECPR